MHAALPCHGQHSIRWRAGERRPPAKLPASETLPPAASAGLNACAGESYGSREQWPLPCISLLTPYLTSKAAGAVRWCHAGRCNAWHASEDGTSVSSVSSSDAEACSTSTNGGSSPAAAGATLSWPGSGLYFFWQLGERGVGCWQLPQPQPPAIGNNLTGCAVIRSCTFSRHTLRSGGQLMQGPPTGQQLTSARLQSKLGAC